MNVKLKLRLLSALQTRFYSPSKRKYPFNEKEADQLPIFQYRISKSTYKRIYVWGGCKTGALGLPFKERDKTLSLREYVLKPRRLQFGEWNEVTTVACGYGFTVFGVNSKTDVKLYGTGINTDGQIGYQAINKDKPMEIILIPQPIHLPMHEKSQIIKLSAGRAHTLVLTNEGLFTFGNNSYGQCGRKIVQDEDYFRSQYVHKIENIDGKKIINIECGQDHSIAITEDGKVYSCGWGADGQTGLGHFDNQSTFSLLKGDIQNECIKKVTCKADFALALSDKGEVFGWGNTEYSQLMTNDDTQQICIPTFVKMCSNFGKVIDIASGGSICMILNEDRSIFTWGFGLLGQGINAQHSKKPIIIPSTLFGINKFQPDTYVESINCGLSHMAAITNHGDLFTWGRNNLCCLGLGNDKDQYYPLKVILGGLVTQVFCGIDHTVALCKPFI